MKHLILPFIAATTLFLLFSPSTTTATDDDNTIYDVTKKPLVAGKDYYVVPYKYGRLMGGFTWKLFKKDIFRCPHYYVPQVKDNNNYGEATAFFPKSGKNTVTLSTNLNIVFSNASPESGLPIICPESSNVWKVVTDTYAGVSYIELGGRKGTSDKSTWFTIEKYDAFTYKIRYCPPYESGQLSVCGTLGFVSSPNGGGQRLLGVNATHPIQFVFQTQPIPPKENAMYVI